MEFWTEVFNDPLVQTHSLALANIVFTWLFFVLKSWDGRTYVKTMISTSCDCGSASWIKKIKFLGTSYHQCLFFHCSSIINVTMKEKCIRNDNNGDIIFPGNWKCWSARSVLLLLRNKALLIHWAGAIFLENKKFWST